MEEQQENQEQPIKILETELLSAKVERDTATEEVRNLIAQVEQLKRENEHLTRDRNVFRDNALARREEAFAAFGQMPFLLDWVESVAGDVAMLKLDENLVSQDVDNAVEEAISDADLISQSEIESLIQLVIDEAIVPTDKISEIIDEAISEADLISQSDIESLIEFAIDEAKEESQSIATDKISEIVEDKILEIDWSVIPRF
jgi:hypothetical protein